MHLYAYFKTPGYYSVNNHNPSQYFTKTYFSKLYFSKLYFSKTYFSKIQLLAEKQIQAFFAASEQYNSQPSFSSM